MSVGLRLREERKRLGLSQGRLAVIAGVAKNTAINWEKSASSPTADALVKLATAGIDAVYVLTGKRLPQGTTYSDEEQAKLDLDDLERELIEPARVQGPNESDAEAEARVLKEATRRLEGILAPICRALYSPEIIERAEALLQAANDPQRLALLRAADFNQARIQREDEAELLEIWLNSSPYQPDHSVMDRLARIAIEYSVPHRTLAELTHEIYIDIEEQRSADQIIALNEAREGEPSRS
ncbi:helix-turn-helix domain-containing protein [Novosphingobium sp. NDB2Meth1]|uniref:helix-turn-helix domain-containing protein n=1 Tax=Novosphingobium sp. NDB2Meth1 TaxID=1892847 RepID=UPI000931E0DC|nr:helix-turn-helix domain-containing protein [Novosphingobium sp. NDB2Meth1]